MLSRRGAAPEDEEAAQFPATEIADASGAFQTKAGRGSYASDDPQRPRWDRNTLLVKEYRYCDAFGAYQFSMLRGLRGDGQKAFLTGVDRSNLSLSDLDLEKRQWPYRFYQLPGLEHFEKGAGDEPNLLYRLPDLTAALAARPVDPVFIAEGEKDCDRLWGLGLIATTNPNGALRWHASFNPVFAARDVAVLIDNDPNGRSRGAMLCRELGRYAKSLKLIALPGLRENGDVSDWLDAGKSKSDLLREVANTRVEGERRSEGELVPSEHSIALAFTDQHRNEFRYDNDARAWFQWDGARWKLEGTRLVFDICRRIAAESGGGRAVQKASFANGAERLAAADRAHSIRASIWDQDPLLVATPDGPTIDLRTGAVRVASPADNITKTLGCAPEEGAPELWLRCLDDWTGGDREQVRFLQSFLGYCLTGLTSEHALLFLFGPGGNGKSVFLNVILSVLGEYAMTAGMETFTASKNERHLTELARLRGARIVSASETEEGKEFNSARIKQATGGDPITANFMRQDHFTYIPQFKLIFVGNDQPRLHQVDEAMKRRINMLPFLHKPAMPDPLLEHKLKEEGPRILAWMIEGCLEWQRQRGRTGGSGLIRPQAVQVANAEYFEGQDLFGQWIEEHCATGPDRQATSAALYASWIAFAQARGEPHGSATAFGLKLAKRYERAKPGGCRGFVGIALRSSNRGERL